MIDAPFSNGGLILGSARCGSTLVSEILRCHPDILSLSELFSTIGANAFRPARLSGARFWSHLSKPSSTLVQVGNPAAAPREFLYGADPEAEHDPYRCPPILSITLPHLTKDPDALFHQLAACVSTWPVRPLEEQYRATFALLANHVGGRRVWVERSGGSLVAARTLRRMFPEARNVVLLRDGADTALSMRDYPATRLAIWMWRRFGMVGIDLLATRSHYGRGAIWPLVEALGGRLDLSSIISRRPTLTDCGAFWSKVMEHGLASIDDPEPFVLSYEDLCSDPDMEIARLGLHLTGSAPTTWLEWTRLMPRRRRSRTEDLSQIEQRELANACAPGAAAITGWLAERR